MRVNHPQDRGTASFDLAPPGPSELFESLRAFGYDLPTALADIIDNSITAGARHVRINFLWQGRDSRITIVDDGSGMTEERLTQAMRAGSNHPGQPRAEHDLGRFGLGMKTASFSQCRVLTVLTRTNGSSHAVRRWDLDYLAELGQGEWRLLKGDDLLTPEDLGLLGESSGTALFWDRLDHVVGDVEEGDEMAASQFRLAIDRVRDHLAMTFHEFMTGDQPLTITLCGTPILPWDPFFLADRSLTTALDEERYQTDGIAMTIKPFILPHHSRITPEDHHRLAGPAGWNAHQGFYIYRNRRLLVAGDWLGLGMQKEEHVKLARIRVDLPNTADQSWQIDVKKSRATPPVALRRDLTRIARLTRSRAKEVYRFKARTMAREHPGREVLLWDYVRHRNRVSYRIRREHPLVSKVLATCPDKAPLLALLAMIEESIPAPHIAHVLHEQPHSMRAPFEGDKDALLAAMAEVYQAFLDSGLSVREARLQLYQTEPFSHNDTIEWVSAFLDSLKDEDH